jgi:hypothetical protein
LRFQKLDVIAHAQRKRRADRRSIWRNRLQQRVQIQQTDDVLAGWCLRAQTGSMQTIYSFVAPPGAAYPEVLDRITSDPEALAA